MPLVRCPACDGSVAAVAARCPHCSYGLAEERRRADGGADEIECHQCRASIASDLPVCCNCGVLSPKPYRPFLTRQVSAVLIIALVVIGGGWARFESFSPWNRSTNLEAETAAVLPARVTTPTANVPALRNVETRWTSTWVNVREQRTTTSQVVLVLDPGVEVEVGNKQGAWWEARVNGHVVGYLSNSVLRTDRPLED